jgi:hypothetical protein
MVHFLLKYVVIFEEIGRGKRASREEVFKICWIA